MCRKRRGSNQIMLSFVTSTETITAKKWLLGKPARHRYWRQQAGHLAHWYGVEGALFMLSRELCAYLSEQIATTTDPLGRTLLECALARIDYFDLSAELLSEVDDSGLFRSNGDDLAH